MRVTAPQPSGETTMRLFERARSGDEQALEQLFARCLPALKRWASGRLPRHARDLAETQDLVQETLIQTFKRLQAIEPRGAGTFQAYLRQAVMNRIRDELRKTGRRGVPAELDTAIPAADPSPLERAIGADAVERYEGALAGLSVQDREAIILRVELGFTYEEIAEALGKPTPGAARKTVERAVVRLAVEMDRAER